MNLKKMKNDLYQVLLSIPDKELTSTEIAIGFYLSQDVDVQRVLQGGSSWKQRSKMKI